MIMMIFYCLFFTLNKSLYSIQGGWQLGNAKR